MYDKSYKLAYTRAAMSLGALIGVVACIVEVILMKIGEHLSKPFEIIFAVLGIVCFLLIYNIGLRFLAKWMLKKDSENA